MDLETPILLVAMPQVLDPNFQMSVVLLIHHQQEGSLGFIVNQPIRLKVCDILEGLDIPWHDREQMAHCGGPVNKHVGTVIFEGDVPLSQQEIFPGVSLSQNVQDLQLLAEQPPAAFRLFLGHAGWGEGQLMQEILRNDWMTAPVSRDLVFAGNPSKTWQRTLESVGVDPEQLPTWTPTDGDAAAN